MGQKSYSEIPRIPVLPVGLSASRTDTPINSVVTERPSRTCCKGTGLNEFAKRGLTGPAGRRIIHVQMKGIPATYYPGDRPSLVRRKTARNQYTLLRLGPLYNYAYGGIMTTQMTIFFDNPETRSQFVADISDLIVYNDQVYREEIERMNYEDTLSFYMPDLDQDERDPESDPGSRMSLRRAEMVLNPSLYGYCMDQVL